MTKRHLVWIRHARVRPDRAAPARDWPLTSEGREAAARLGRSLRGLLPPVSVVTSDERKAVETADQVTAALGLGPAEICAGLREVERPWTDGDYRAVARAYLRTGAAPGWEPRDDVLERISAALAEHWRPQGTTIAVGHGLAMSVWVANAVPGLEAVQFWDGLTFPDAWRFDADGGGTLRRILV